MCNKKALKTAKRYTRNLFSPSYAEFLWYAKTKNMPQVLSAQTTISAKKGSLPLWDGTSRILDTCNGSLRAKEAPTIPGYFPAYMGNCTIFRPFLLRTKIWMTRRMLDSSG